MRPMLAHVYEPKRVRFPVYVQPKFNGVRALCGTDDDGRRRFQSRDEIPWKYEVLAHLSKALDYLPKHIVLDGELYRHGWLLQKIAGACSVARSEPSADTAELVYVIFDTVNYLESFAQRVKTLQVIIDLNLSPHIQVATTILCCLELQVNDIYSNLVKSGFEGIIYRDPNGPYTIPKQANQHFPRLPKFLSDKDNRVWHMLKQKAWQDGEFTITNVIEGEGKRAGMVGAFEFDCGYHKFGRVGSGLSDAEALHYFQNPPIGRKIKVKFLTLTADGIPFNPTFEALL